MKPKASKETTRPLEKELAEVAEAAGAVLSVPNPSQEARDRLQKALQKLPVRPVTGS